MFENMPVSTWISFLAFIVSVISLMISYSHKRKQDQFRKSKIREGAYQVLSDSKYILENPPANGFDHTGKMPYFRIQQLDECISHTGYFSIIELKELREARAALYEVKLVVDEVNNLTPPLKGNVKFRARFPDISKNCLAKIGEALKTYGSN